MVWVWCVGCVWCVWYVCVCVCLVCVCVVSCGCLMWHLCCSGACFADYLWLRFRSFEWVCLWCPFGLGGEGSGRAGLSAPRLPPHHPALRPKRGFRKGSCHLPVGGRWPTPFSKIAMLDTEKARSACQVIPKVGVVTLCGCRKPGANLHQPGIEPGSHRWQRCILPLDH